MFWPVHHRKFRSTNSSLVGPAPKLPSLEVLEGRALFSVGVTPLADLSQPLAQSSSAQSALLFASHGNTNGAAGQIPAFFNDESVTINVKELSDTASASIIAHNKSLKTIYVTNDLDEEQDFAPVINAVPGQGFNALWLQIRISFNPGVTPHQFTSEADILAAAQAGQITLINTGEVYRDSIVGGQNG